MPANAGKRPGHRFRHPTIQLISMLVASVAVLTGAAPAAASSHRHGARAGASVAHAGSLARTEPVAPYTVSPRSQTSSVVVTPATLHTIPRSFLGLSVNVNEMEDYTDSPAFPNYIRLLTPPDDGRFNFRVGGTEADESYWDNDEATVLPQYQVAPYFSYTIDQPFLSSLAGLVRATGASVILNVNAAAHDPQMAVSLLQAAERTLPSGALQAAAIGNEPDLYHKPTNDVSHNQQWGFGFGAAQYATLFGQYARTLTSAFPHLPLAGPEISDPAYRWETKLFNGDPGEVGLATVHLYPWNACAPKSSRGYPVTGYYLLARDALNQARTLQRVIAIAHSQHLPFRLTELGSATCHGVEGVNNTFATALWAINQLFDLIDVGVGGVNVHLRADEPNTAIQSISGLLTARPLFYGLATFAQALGDGARQMRVTGNLPANVKLWAVYTPRAWHLVFVNGNATEQTVDALVAPDPNPMTTSLLSAPSPGASTATLAGQTLSPGGTWLGRAEHTVITRSARGTYNVAIPPNSAILGTIPIAQN